MITYIYKHVLSHEHHDYLYMDKELVQKKNYNF